MTQIIAHTKLDGGKLLSAKNAHNIVARSTVATDRMGNRIESSPCADKTPYFQKWVIQKEAKGYIFREVSHGGGICGCHPTVRQLVVSTLALFGPSKIIVEVLDGETTFARHRAKEQPTGKLRVASSEPSRLSAQITTQ
jgi:hypothetical protein